MCSGEDAGKFTWGIRYEAASFWLDHFQRPDEG